MEPARRSDARRNRERILAAAAAFADRSLGEVSMAEVARRAGVGMATLYRNYPGRRELLEALFAKEVDDLCRAAEDAAEQANEPTAGSPVEVLRNWLRRFAVFHENKHPIAAELLRHTDRADPLFDTSRDRVTAAGRPLLVAAQQAHQARSDLTIDQVLDLVLAVVTIPADPAYVEPILRTALDGLRP